MEKERIPGKLINQEAPILYREIAKKFFERHPSGKITRNEAKRILGMCFKVGKHKRGVLEELEGYGLIIFVNRKEYYVNWVEVEGDEEGK